MGFLLMHVLSISLFIASASAQVGPEANSIPPCVKACDPAAIASVNCTNADQYCHCVRQDGILSNITSCADAACTNPSADLHTFTTLFAQVCSKFNITVPALGSNTSANGTTVTPPYTGAADRIPVGISLITGLTFAYMLT